MRRASAAGMRRASQAVVEGERRLKGACYLMQQQYGGVAGTGQQRAGARVRRQMQKASLPYNARCLVAGTRDGRGRIYRHK